MVGAKEALITYRGELESSKLKQFSQTGIVDSESKNLFLSQTFTSDLSPVISTINVQGCQQHRLQNPLQKRLLICIEMSLETGKGGIKMIQISKYCNILNTCMQNTSASPYLQICSVGFFVACEYFWRLCNHSFCAPALFFFFFFKWRLVRDTLIPLLMPESVHGGSAS